MLQLATFELMLQLMPPAKYDECMKLIDPRYGVIGGEKTAGEQYAAYQEELDQTLANTAEVTEADLQPVASVDSGPVQTDRSVPSSALENIPSSAGEASSNVMNEVPDGRSNGAEAENSVPLYKRDDGVPRGR